MTQLEALKEALEIARAMPNPFMYFAEEKTEAAAIARSFGAVKRKNRFGFGGAWVGYDYFTENGHLCLSSMSCTSQ